MSNTMSIRNAKDIPPDTLVVCLPWTTPLAQPDNVRAVCSHCGRVLQHRPHVPAKLIKICMECIAPIIKDDIAEGDCEVMITPESARELSEWLKRRRQ